MSKVLTFSSIFDYFKENISIMKRRIFQHMTILSRIARVDEGHLETSTMHSARVRLVTGNTGSPVNFSRIASGLKLAQTQAMAVAVAGFYPHSIRSPLLHRASFHGRGNKGAESNGSIAGERLSHSLPGSPADRRPNFPEVIGSAESLVGRVLVEQGLGKFCDPEFVRCTSREMQEAPRYDARRNGQSSP